MTSEEIITALKAGKETEAKYRDRTVINSFNGDKLYSNGVHCNNEQYQKTFRNIMTDPGMFKIIEKETDSFGNVLERGDDVVVSDSPIDLNTLNGRGPYKYLERQGNRFICGTKIIDQTISGRIHRWFCKKLTKEELNKILGVEGWKEKN